MSKRTLNNFLIFSALLIILSSCSFTSRISYNQKEKLLQSNLSKWNTFKLEGIIEVNHKAFSFRKNIIIKKNRNKLRLDVFDSGVLGLSPTPFFSAHLDSLLTVRLPGSNELIEIPLNKLQEDFPYLNYFIDIEQLMEHKDIILESDHIQLNEVIFQFSENMELIKIEHQKKEHSIIIKYDKEVDEIVLFDKYKKTADILIDKITFSEVDIKPIN